MGHARHSVAPVTLEYFPCPHEVQLPAEEMLEYLPVLQLVQARSVAEFKYLPGTHVAHVIRLAIEYQFRGQAVHVLVPVRFEYFPAAHKVQAVAEAEEE